jgi:N-acyl-D-amino-acid deacylase
MRSFTFVRTLMFLLGRVTGSIAAASGAAALVGIAALLSSCGGDAPSKRVYDLVLRGGTIYDGSGGQPFVGDLAIRGDVIVAIGDLGEASGKKEIDVRGLAVAPGFVNMMCWANESLIEDGRSQSDIRQGVTLEVMGESNSMGPLNAAMKEELIRQQVDITYDIEWTTLGEYLEYLERRGVSPNVASFIGAATPRTYVIGHEDRPPTVYELGQMQELVRQAMEEGALGVASALIYPPGSFAATDELVALAETAAAYDGLYASHIRGEGSNLVKAVDELIEIARRAGIRAEIYHFKAAGQANWPLFEQAVAEVERARSEGLQITADVYTYPAGATGLNSCMPPWVQEGGFEASLERLKDPVLRRRIAREMLEESDQWENMYLGAGSPDNILLVEFKNEKLKPLTGTTLAEVAAMRGTSPELTAMDLIVEDESRVTCVYFNQSEEVLRRAIALPWVSFCSDAASLAPEGVFLESSTHPRAYGSFARLLGKYVRDERLIPLEKAIRKLAALPAENLGIERRGRLEEGFFADVVVFDPQTIQDHATYLEPHQYATGMVHVFVNGTQVLRDGEHTGATPGRVVRGPGWSGQGSAETTPTRAQ